jgi:hypothetical protein
MTLDRHSIDIIAERVETWVSTGDPFSLRADDVLDLLRDVRTLNDQHRHDVALLRRAREQLAAERERADQLANTILALTAQQRAEIAEPVLADDAADLDPP